MRVAREGRKSGRRRDELNTARALDLTRNGLEATVADGIRDACEQGEVHRAGQIAAPPTGHQTGSSASGSPDDRPSARSPRLQDRHELPTAGSLRTRACSDGGSAPPSLRTERGAARAGRSANLRGGRRLPRSRGRGLRRRSPRPSDIAAPVATAPHRDPGSGDRTSPAALRRARCARFAGGTRPRAGRPATRRSRWNAASGRPIPVAAAACVPIHSLVAPGHVLVQRAPHGLGKEAAVAIASPLTGLAGSSVRLSGIADHSIACRHWSKT